MTDEDPEGVRLRAVALQNASAILRARKRAESEVRQAKSDLELKTQELAESLSLMRATLESTAEGILVTDRSGRVVTFNSQYLQISGLPADQVQGARHREIFDRIGIALTGDDAAAARLDEIYSHQELESLDTLDLADGRRLERYSRPQYIGGAIVGRVWSFRDITARKLAEEALLDETRILDLLNRTGAAVAATLEIEAILQTVTDTATQLSGARFGAFFYNTTNELGEAYQLVTLSGASSADFAQFGMPRATPVFAPTFRGDAPVRSDDITQDPRYGRVAPHHGLPRGHIPVRSYLAASVKSRDNETIGGLFFGHPEAGVFTKRSERLVVGIAAQASLAIENARLYEEARRLARERETLVEAERAARTDIARVSRMKDEFLATLSHELRTPLSAVLGWSKVLATRHKDVDDLSRGLDVITRNAVAQARLIDDLLDMNRIVSGKVRLEVQPTDVGNVVLAAVEAAKPAADAKGIRLRTVIDPLAGFVSGDPNRLQQVVWNLLTNAVKFTQRGGKIDVLLQRVNSHLEITVRDNGIGIEAIFLPLVFDRFRQADASTTRSHGGLGIGLSITKQLVELHGGTIDAASDGPGRGASFVVNLPLTAVRIRSDSEHPTASGDPATTMPLVRVDLTGVSILVVDDESDARELLREIFMECGALVTMAPTAAEAIELLQMKPPDVLVSDIGLPGTDGYELIRRVRKLPVDRGGRTPAIALTAFARSEDRTRAMLAGYHVHVAKPVEPQELLATVCSLVGRAEPPTPSSRD